MKLIEYKPEFTIDVSAIPQITQKMTPTEIMELFYSERLEFRDPEGLEKINQNLWECAKPKLDLEFGKMIVFGTSGESDRDIAKEFGIPLEFTDDDFEIHWLSESHIQEAEWRERKRKCPSLTVKDLQWVDKMVDEIYEKHTRDLSKESFKIWSENFFKLPFNKTFGVM